MSGMSFVPRRAIRPGIIRLDALSSATPIDIELCHNGVLILTSNAPEDVAAKLSELGVGNPRPLVDGVYHFDAVEIDENKAGWK